MNALYRSLGEIKAIADAVVDDGHDCAGIIGVTAGRDKVDTPKLSSCGATPARRRE
jgi:hypothetical protein